MPKTLLFPLAQMALSLGASVVYAFAKDWKHAAYWLLGCLISGCVSLLK